MTNVTCKVQFSLLAGVIWQIVTNRLDCVFNISCKWRSKRLNEHCWLTDDEEEDKADDEEWGATDGHPASKLDEGWEQQRGPEQEVKQRPGSAARDYCRSGELSHLVVIFLQGILTTRQEAASLIIKSSNAARRFKSVIYSITGFILHLSTYSHFNFMSRIWNLGHPQKWHFDIFNQWYEK